MLLCLRLFVCSCVPVGARVRTYVCLRVLVRACASSCVLASALVNVCLELIWVLKWTCMCAYACLRVLLCAYAYACLLMREVQGKCGGNAVEVQVRTAPRLLGRSWSAVKYVRLESSSGRVQLKCRGSGGEVQLTGR